MSLFSLDDRDRFYLVLLIGLSFLTAAFFVTFLVLSGFPDPTISPDGPGYVSVTEYLKGNDVQLNKFRISRPIIPLLALPLSYLVETRLAFVINNAILFVVLVGAFYFLSRELTGESRSAFLSVLLLVFAYPVYYRGINVTVDLSSWVLFVGVALTILHFRARDRLTTRISSVLAVVCAVGTLMTELALASFLLVFFEYTIMNFRKQRIPSLLKDLFIIGSCFTLPFLIFQWAIYMMFDYSIFQKALKQMNWIQNNPVNNGLMGLARVVIGAFNVSLIFVTMGILQYRKTVRLPGIHLAMLAAILVTLLVVYTNTIRFSFVLFPLVFTFSVRGVSWFASKLGTVDSTGTGRVRMAEALIIAGICGFNVLLYVGFLRYGSTFAMAKHFLSFLM